MKIVLAVDYRRVSWKNGGGVTAEIAAFPANASMEDFGWRISMADVAADGPFSCFPGVDRTLTLLEGQGMVLEIEGQGRRELDPASPPLSFAGDVPVMARLADGPVRDLNVMTRRGRFSHSVTPIAVEGHRALVIGAATAVIFCRSGWVAVEGQRLAPMDAALTDRALVDLQGAGEICLILLRREEAL